MTVSVFHQSVDVDLDLDKGVDILEVGCQGMTDPISRPRSPAWP